MALELVKSMPMPGKAKQQNLGGGLHSDGHVLLYIDYHQSVMPKDIAETLGISTARVASILNKLSDDGFIARQIDNDDRRQIIVTLTEHGKETAKQQKELIIEKVSLFLERLGEYDAKEYVRIMGRLAEISKNSML